MRASPSTPIWCLQRTAARGARCDHKTMVSNITLTIIGDCTTSEDAAPILYSDRPHSADCGASCRSSVRSNLKKDGWFSIMHNLVIQFTNLAFAAILETSPTVSGPWKEVHIRYAGCPQKHTFAVSTSKPLEFLRVRFLDNGVEPTPENVSASRWTSTSIAVSATLQFRCDDSQAGPYEFWRAKEGGEFTLIRTQINPAFLDTNLPPGTYLYRARIVGGLFSTIEPRVTLP
jgi:hypothetical protein